MLSYFVDEPGIAASNHIDDRLEALSARGVAVTVVGGRQRGRRTAALARNVQLHGVSDWHLRPFLRDAVATRLPASLRRRARALVDGVGRFGADQFVDGTWARRVSTYVRTAMQPDAYDLIYSTGGPAAAHLAASTLAAQLNRPWIAELQDPLVFDGLSAQFRATSNDVAYLARAEDALRRADAVVCVTETCAGHYRHKLGSDDVYCIYPGASVGCRVERATAPRPHNRGRLRFLHAGSVLGARRISTFLDVIRQLGLEDRVELVLAGEIDLATARLVRQHRSFVRHIGRLTRLETTREIQAADVCLVIQHAGAISALTIPSKFYEYAALNARILFLGYRNAEVEALCRRLNVSFADQAVPSAISEVLRALVERPDAARRARPVPIHTATEQFLGLCSTVLRAREDQRRSQDRDASASRVGVAAEGA